MLWNIFWSQRDQQGRYKVTNCEEWISKLHLYVHCRSASSKLEKNHQKNSCLKPKQVARAIFGIKISTGANGQKHISPKMQAQWSLLIFMSPVHANLRNHELLIVRKPGKFSNENTKAMFEE